MTPAEKDRISRELHDPCDFAKCFLSNNDRTTIKKRLEEGEYELDVVLTRSDFEKIAEPVF